MGPLSRGIISGGHPRIVKLLDSFGSADWIKRQDPGIAVVGRIFLASQPQTGDPAAAAEAWWSSVRATVTAYPAVDYWEGYNEPAVGSEAAMAWYAAMEAERVRLLANHSLRAAIGCFSAGVPDVTQPDVVTAFFPAVDAALQHSGILSLHEYAAPFLNSTFSGDPSTGEGWLTGRYRKLYRGFLAPTKRILPLVISETGIDGGTCGVSGSCPSHPMGDGWKAFCDDWSGLGHVDCPAYYLQQLQWYDAVMRADAYVLGCTVFSLEISGWDAFDVSPLAGLLQAYLNATH